MAAPHSVTAIVPCNDLDVSETFYARLDFVREGHDQSTWDHDYRILTDGRGAGLHLSRAVEGWVIPGRNPLGLYVYTEAVDTLAARFDGEILGQVPHPEAKPWGMYDFAVSDPDGVLVRVGWPVRLMAKADR